MRSLLPIIFVLIALGLFFVYIDPTYQEIKVLRAQEGQYDSALTKSKELQATRDTLLGKYNTFASSDLERLTKLIPDNVDNVRLVLDLDGIAATYGMSIRNVLVSGSGVERAQRGAVGPSASPYESVVLSFSVFSTYDDFIRFLEDLEQSLRIVDIISISFTAPEGDLYEFSVSVRTYWLK